MCPVICYCRSEIIHSTIMCTTTWNLVTTVAAQEKPPIIKYTHTITQCICTKLQKLPVRLKCGHPKSFMGPHPLWKKSNSWLCFPAYTRNPLMLHWVSVHTIHVPHKLLICWPWTQEGMLLYLEVCQPTKTLECVGCRSTKNNHEVCIWKERLLAYLHI